MFRLFKCFLIVLFLDSLALLTLFYLPEEYYGHWTISFILFTILAVLISIKMVPSRRHQQLVRKTVEELRSIQKLEEELLTRGRAMELACPSCKEKSTFWSFLENFKCKSCGSDLFGTVLDSLDPEYRELMLKRERVSSFYERVPAWLLRKARRRDLFDR